jgi:hypothetical protein
MVPPIDYAAIAARAAQANQKWAEPHVQKLVIRLFMAALIYEAIAAACTVHGLLYDDNWGAAHDAFALKMGEREIRYEWCTVTNRITRRRSSGKFASTDEVALQAPAGVEAVGVAAQQEIAQAVLLLVGGW